MAIGMYLGSSEFVRDTMFVAACEEEDREKITHGQ